MSKVRFEGERQRYIVQAHNERFAVMTKPFNARRTFLYTITDLERGERGPCNLIFGLPPMERGADTPEGGAEILNMLMKGELAVSRRKCVSLLPSETKQLRALTS